MKLHEVGNDFQDLVIATAQSMNIREVYVEKDYWVTFLLSRMVSMPNKERVVFKGGTSLSKGYRLIKRFSEDVDLAIIRDGLTNAATEHLIKDISKFLAKRPFEEVPDSATSKMGLSRRTLHSYPRQISGGNFGPVRENILLEISCFGTSTPNALKTITSFVGEFLKSNGAEADIKGYGLESFEVPVLDCKRTFVEKILSLSYASFMDADTQDIEVRARVRHFYDLTVLLSTTEIKNFVISEQFAEAMKFIREEERLSTRTKWVNEALSSAPLHRKSRVALNAVEGFFRLDLEPMVYHPEDLPEFSEVRTALDVISEQIRSHNL